jgi:maleamate amidohydrolase
MSSRIWEDLLSQQDKAVIRKAGYDQKGAASWESRGLGTRPVVLVIDMQRITVGRNVPILEAVEDYRTAIGTVAWQAIDQIVPVLDAAREVDVPVTYTRVIPRGCAPEDEAVQIVEPLIPQADDLIIDKNYASAFYGTALLTHLIQRRIDTVIIVGNTTGGCVRATAVDARQHGYSVVVPQECVFDRIEASHKIGLLDLWMKYAEVVPAADVLDYLRNLK